ncbi:MAG: uracil-DNA glycosylase family protein [Rubrimonas sp.]
MRACRACADRFAATATAHAPRPVLRGGPEARILIAGQAPGARVHASGLPFDDPSGDRLRDWLGVDRATFYDETLFATAPMAFCFPGYDARGADLPPPPLCARLWRARLLAAMPRIALTVLVGAHAIRWTLGDQAAGPISETVRNWRRWFPAALPTPHPSWRNTAWLKRNPWFEAETVPALRARVAALLR